MSDKNLIKQPIKALSSEEALQQLVTSFASWQKKVDDLYTAGKPEEGDAMTFVITVDDVSTAFEFGGPTVYAMIEFITALADEWDLSVDFVHNTVSKLPMTASNL